MVGAKLRAMDGDQLERVWIAIEALDDAAPESEAAIRAAAANLFSVLLDVDQQRVSGEPSQAHDGGTA